VYEAFLPALDNTILLYYYEATHYLMEE